MISKNTFKNVEKMYELRRKYKSYLQIKCLIPLNVIGLFTCNELSKIAYAAELGSKSIALTLLGFIFPYAMLFRPRQIKTYLSSL